MKITLDRGIRFLILANLVLVALLLTAVVVDSVNSEKAGHPTQAEGSASASPDLMPMGLAHIPTSSACVLCHGTGGTAALKTIPALGHPLEGWRQCVICHTDEKLGRTAPGHIGIAQTECLNCHKVAQPGPAITAPHSRLQDQHCLDCHGSFAHLPSSMASRHEDQCTLCHKPTELPPPQFEHQMDTRLSCRECHRSPEVGNLPIDHALRADTTCLLCHDIKRALPTASPSASPALGYSPLP
jgi:hypothetical protein